VSALSHKKSPAKVDIPQPHILKLDRGAGGSVKVAISSNYDFSIETAVHIPYVDGPRLARYFEII
jgi:hypothetical protein